LYQVLPLLVPPSHHFTDLQLATIILQLRCCLLLHHHFILAIGTATITLQVLPCLPPPFYLDIALQTDQFYRCFAFAAPPFYWIFALATDQFYIGCLCYPTILLDLQLATDHFNQCCLCCTSILRDIAACNNHFTRC